jgi:rhomboid protease GluP
MAARLCSYCQRLNSEGEARCYHCGRRLPGPLLSAAFDLKRDLLGVSAPMTRLVIAIELVAFALCVIADRRVPIGFGDMASSDFGTPSGAFRASTLVRFGALIRHYVGEEPFRLLSAGFVHANLLHVGMNLFMFAQFGSRLEHELGSARSLVLFVLSVIAGSLASTIWLGRGLMVGASGGVFGQFGAFVGLLYASRDPGWKRTLATGVIYAVLVSLAFRQVDTAAHVGGFAAGAVLGFALFKEQRQMRLHRVQATLAGVALISCVASVVLSARSPFVERARDEERQLEE